MEKPVRLSDCPQQAIAGSARGCRSLSARNELLIASPYIKQKEAGWVCDELAIVLPNDSCRLKVLTDIRSNSVLGGSSGVPPDIF